jgi:5-methyltetrahydropteroyltriglutamate--homocysteine methyltransferase
VSPSSAPAALGRAVCSGPITYKGQAAVQRDIENFRAALAGVHVEEAFLPAAAPTMVQYGSRNEYYPSDEAYVYALADALQEEYNAMVNAGFLLQIDAPELPAMYDRMLASDLTLQDYRNYATLCVEAINHALAGIPEDRVRYHAGAGPGW